VLVWVISCVKIEYMPEETPIRSTRPRKTLLVSVTLIIVLAVIGFIVWKMLDAKTYEPPMPPMMMQPPVQTTSTFASSTLGFSIQYPSGYAVDDAFAYDQFGPEKLIHGVKFTIPMEMATGTNLSSADTGVSVEWLPRAKKCTGDIYLLANVKAGQMAEASTTYSVASSSGAAAGNVYEETVYALADSSPCKAVRYFIHSTNMGNYAAGTVREFDRAALMNEFEKIRRSLQLQ